MKLHKDQRISSTIPDAFMSPWLIIGGAVILGVVIVVLTLNNLDRDARSMARMMSEKGAAIIKAMEAGARTGVRGQLGAEMRMQVLIEEMGTQRDLLFIMVTDPSGKILMHSNRRAEGVQAFSKEDMANMTSGKQVKSRVVSQGPNRAFVVYRNFLPLLGRTELRDIIERWRKNAKGNRAPRLLQRGMHNGRHKEHGGVASLESLLAREKEPPVIFVGMDISLFEQARQRDRTHAIVMGCIMLLVGLTGFISLIWAQSARRSRQLAQDSQAFAAEIVAGLPDGIILADAEGRIAFMNDIAEEMLGVAEEHSLGKLPEETLPAVIATRFTTLETKERLTEEEVDCTRPGTCCNIPLAEASNGNAGHAQPEDTDTAGTSQSAACTPQTASSDQPICNHADCVPVGVRGSRIVTEEDTVVGSVLILRDLREVRQLQEEIRRKEKLAAIGSLAAGVAHEIRNPLSSIKGYATYLGSRFPEDSDDRGAANIMVQEVERLNRVITDLIGLSRPSDITRKQVNIVELADHALRLVRQDAAAQGVYVDLDVDDDVPAVAVDPDRFTQALLNISLNAVEAMPQGGDLTISLERDFDDPAFVRISVADTGTGIPEDILKRIFDPYYTTKSQGTGLGLAIVHKIVEAHGGTIHAASTMGEGTEFTMLLPIAPISSEAQGDETQNSPASHVDTSVYDFADSNPVRVNFSRRASTATKAGQQADAPDETDNTESKA